jgi:Flp pilus assembly protein TadD/4-amino-4-deoxy-L-arabinose transferase-like glycosyltransferase
MSRSTHSSSWIQRNRWPLFIFLLALGLRLGVILTTLGFSLLQANVGDAYEYELLADRILAGDLGAGTQVFFHSSAGYPYLLALLWAIFGKSLLVARLFQALAGALNVVVIYALAKRLFGDETRPGQRRGEIVGRISGLLLAFYGYIAFLEQNLLMTAYELLTIDSALLFLLLFIGHQRWRHLVGAGICLGLACLGRPNVWLVAVVMAVFVFFLSVRSWKWKPLRSLGAAAVLVALTLAVILPITLRNAIVAGDPVLLTSNAGINFWIGNHEEASGVFRVPRQMEDNLCEASSAEAAAASGRSLSAGEVSSYWFRRTVDILVGNPKHALRIMARKTLLFFNAHEIPNHLDFYFVRARGAWFLWGLPVGFWLVVPLGLTGMILWRPWSVKHWLIFTYLSLYFLMVVGLFVTGRYRIPTIPALTPFAAWMIYRVVDLLRRKQWRSLGGVVLVLIPAAVLANWGTMEQLGEAHNWALVAEAEQRQGHPQQAAAALEKAKELDPNNPHFYNNLGLAARQRGDLVEAERLLRQAYELSGGNPDNASNLAGVLAQRGRPAEAVEILEAALQRSPQSLNCLINLAFTHYASGRPDLALDPAKKSLAVNGGVPQSYNLLALAYVAQGDTTGAVQYLEQGTREFPQDQGLWVTMAQIEAIRGNLNAARAALDRAQRLPGRDGRIPALRARLQR